MTAQRRHCPKWNFNFILPLLGALLLSLSVQADEQQANQQQAAASDAKRGSVARAMFTSQIADREPVDDLTTAPNTLGQIYFFSDLRDLEGQIVSHRWEYNGEVMAEVKFQVGGPRWRVYSSKNLLPEWIGQWTVIIADESGWPIKASVFEYTQATAQ